MYAHATHDIGVGLTAIIMALFPIIGLLYFLLFPFVGIGIAIYVLCSEIRKSI